MAGGTPARCARRRPVLLRGRLDRDLLPADLPGPPPPARERVVLPVLRGGGTGRLSLLQAVPAQAGGAAASHRDPVGPAIGGAVRRHARGPLPCRPDAARRSAPADY